MSHSSKKKHLGHLGLLEPWLPELQSCFHWPQWSATSRGKRTGPWPSRCTTHKASCPLKGDGHSWRMGWHGTNVEDITFTAPLRLNGTTEITTVTVWRTVSKLGRRSPPRDTNTPTECHWGIMDGAGEVKMRPKRWQFPWHPKKLKGQISSSKYPWASQPHLTSP